MPSKQELLNVISIQTEIVKLGLDLVGVMEFVVERTLSLLDANSAAIELAEEDDMVYRAVAGTAAPYIGLRLKRKNSMSGLCVATGNILYCEDSEIDLRVDREACRKIKVRSMIVIPLQYNESTVGVLKAMSDEPGKFSDKDIELLGLLSDLVGAAMYLSSKYDSDALFRKATHDELTGLANRSLFMDHFRNILTQSQRNKHPFGVLMIDMDGLKQINDTHGHRIGDAVIKEFAQRIKSGGRASDTIARLGGDEFGIILTPLDTNHGIDLVIQRLYSNIERPFSFEDAIYPLRASIGAAKFPEDGDDFGNLIEIADKNMYAVKREHKNSQKKLKSSSKVIVR